MSGAVMNYDFGPKRHWRRWVWNRIVERLSVPPREAVCLYLPGSTDFDRPIALSKGFRPENLIGIEKVEEALLEMRSRGVLAARGNFEDCVFASAKNRRIDVVFGDFCSGLMRNLPRVAFVWNLHPNMKDAVFAFNLMRGRDAASNAYRERFVEFAGKHRGKVVFLGLVSELVRHEQRLDSTFQFDDELFSLVSEHSAPDFNSYKSTSGQVFDSTVWRGLLAGTHGDAMWDSVDIDRIYKGSAALVSAGKSMAPIWAHRTRRISA